MKTILSLAFGSMLLITVISSCKKTDTSSQPAKTSQWRLRDTLYHGLYTGKYGGCAGGVTLCDSWYEMYDQYHDECDIYFASFPSKNGTYGIRGFGTGSQRDSTKCAFDIYTSTLNGQSDAQEFESFDGGSGSVNVIAEKGKITINFSNVAVKESFNPSEKTTASGTLIYIYP